MPAPVLTFQGLLTLKLGAAAAVDVSSEVTKCVIKVERADTEVPATLGTPKSHLGGSRTYTLEIGGFSTDGTQGILLPLLWSAIGTPAKQLDFVLQLRDGAVSASNPKWTGTIIVAGTQLGADVGDLSTMSITNTLTAAPVRSLV